ncbi:MAG: Ku protein [Pseudomonadota bacterium]
MAPRAYWKGYLKLALVSCPVKLYSATSSSSKISFNQLHKDTMNRVQMKYHDPELGEIERSDLVKGYQFEKDKYIIVDKEELDAIQIESNKTIEIEGFIDADDVDDLYLDSPYFLGPDGPIAEETYAVVKEALNRANKVAIARIVLSGRERMITLRPYGDGFLLTTLRTKEEVRDADKYFDEFDKDLDEDLLQMAEMIIKQKEMEFDPSTFEDRYETALMELIKAKIAGKEPVISKAPEQGKVINLMDALKASIDEERMPAAASKPKAASKAKPAKSKSRKTGS